MNPYFLIGGAVAAVVYTGVVFGLGHKVASDSCDADRLRSQVTALVRERDTWKAAAESASKARDEIEAKLAARDKAGTEFAAGLDPAKACRDPDAARRLRTLQ